MLSYALTDSCRCSNFGFKPLVKFYNNHYGSATVETRHGHQNENGGLKQLSYLELRQCLLLVVLLLVVLAVVTGLWLAATICFCRTSPAILAKIFASIASVETLANSCTCLCTC